MVHPYNEVVGSYIKEKKHRSVLLKSNLPDTLLSQKKEKTSIWDIYKQVCEIWVYEIKASTYNLWPPPPPPKYHQWEKKQEKVTDRI